MVKRNPILLVLFVVVIILATVHFGVCIARGETVFDTEYNNNSKTLIVRNQQGGYVASLYMKGYSFGRGVATDSGRSVLYFATYYGYNGKYCYLYSYDLNSKQYSMLAKLPELYYSFDVKEQYNGSLYLNGWNPSDNTAMFRYSLSDHSLKKIADVGYVQRYKHYIIMDPTQVMGSFSPYSLCVYNTSTGKVRRLARQCGGWSRVGRWIYYSNLTKTAGFGSSKFSYSISKHSITSGKTRKMLRKLDAFSVGRITSAKIYYTTDSAMRAYVCSIKGRNKKKLNMQKYYRICGMK